MLSRAFRSQVNLGVVVLLVKAANAGRVDQIAAFGIFGFSLIVLYLASTLYHLSPLTSAGVARLRRVDDLRAHSWHL